jgi:DNA-binding NtrC family response regulator
MEPFIEQFLIPILAGTMIIFIAGATWILFLINQQAKKKSVLIVDDAEHVLKQLGEFLEKGNYIVHQADSREKAGGIITNEKLDYAIIDLWLKGDKSPEGVYIFQFLLEKKPEVKPIMLSGVSNIEEAMEEFKKYLEGTPEEIDKMLQKVKDNFISKGDPKKNYLLAIQEKLGVFQEKIQF